MKIVITGHRPQHLPCGYSDNHPVRRYIELAIERHLRACEKKYGEKPTLITGMALGVDQWAASVCLRLGYPYIAYIPCKGQESQWSKPQQYKYVQLLNGVSDMVYTHSGPYYDGCMTKRNEAMVNILMPGMWYEKHGDHVLAIWTGKETGGTAHCVRYAHSKGVHVEVIDPTCVPASVLASTAITELRKLITPQLTEAFEMTRTALLHAIEIGATNPQDTDICPELRQKIAAVGVDICQVIDLLNKIKTPR